MPVICKVDGVLEERMVGVELVWRIVGLLDRTEEGEVWMDLGDAAKLLVAVAAA